MGPLEIHAAGAGANPLLPSGYEIAVTVFGFLFVVALVVAVFVLIAKLARGTRTRAAATSSRVHLQEEIARRTDSIETRLRNIERTFQGVGE